MLFYYKVVYVHYKNLDNKIATTNILVNTCQVYYYYLYDILYICIYIYICTYMMKDLTIMLLLPPL